MHRRLPAAVLLTLCLGLTACSSEPEATRDDTGAVASQGAVDAFSVALGDCVQEPPATDDVELVEQVEAVPCDQPHDGEVYALFDMPDGDFPGEEAVSTAGDDRCVTEFATFIGTSYEESRYDITTLFPTQDSWEELDDREVVCIVLDPEGGQLTGSLEGVAE